LRKPTGKPTGKRAAGRRRVALVIVGDLIR
jgi:hypothetical protein